MEKNNTKKIYTIGPAGSGKSTLANKLSKRYGLAVLDLDNIFWKVKYTEENSSTAKQRLLKEFLNNPSLRHSNSTKIKQICPDTTNHKYKIQNSQMAKYPDSNRGWIIEGANQEFINPTAKYATKIIWLNPNIFTLFYRITKRFLKNKKSNPSETWTGLYWLLRGVVSYKLRNDLYRRHKDIWEKIKSTPLF